MPAGEQKELLVRLDDVLRDYAGVPGALIPVLQIAQAMFGYLPETALRKIAWRSASPTARWPAWWAFIRFSPPFLAASTWSASAWARPATYAAASRCSPSLKDALGIEVGETTPDRLFSLDVGRCFGACGLAPVIMIDEDVHQRVKPARLARILEKYRRPETSDANGGEAHDGNYRQRRSN